MEFPWSYHPIEARMPTVITDEYMRDQLQRTRTYSLVVLRPGPRHGEEGIESIIWEHGRRNFELRPTVSWRSSARSATRA
jgi:hypothetical protein